MIQVFCLSNIRELLVISLFHLKTLWSWDKILICYEAPRWQQSNCNERSHIFWLMPSVFTDRQRTQVIKQGCWTHTVTQIPASILNSNRGGWFEDLEMDSGYKSGFKIIEKELLYSSTTYTLRRERARSQLLMPFEVAQGLQCKERRGDAHDETWWRNSLDSRGW